MHSGPIESVLLVHGYSVRTLNSWGRLPQLLQADGLAPEAIFLSAFVSLDDFVTCNDLAAALERRIAALERDHGLDLAKTAIICHSTGALVTRRWLLDRRTAGSKMPSHLITAAGANHGSTLAQLGRSELAHVFRHLTGGTDVGKRVLEDLDYGSVFARTLNREWLDAWNDAAAPLWQDTYCFSMGGADHSYWQNQLVWQSRESGSDGTVRISGANLNYRFIDLAPPYQTMTPVLMKQPAPHLVAETADKRYSHTSQHEADTLGIVLGKVTGVVSEIAHLGSKPQPVSQQSYGILEGIAAPDERPFRALKEAFSVQDPDAYARLATSWYNETNVWGAANPDDVNATIVVAIADERGAIVDDSLVLIRDDEGIRNTSQSLLGPPIKNQLSPSVLSFYVNVPKFRAAHPHSIHIEARTNTPYVSYSLTLDGPLSDDTAHSVTDNQLTYVDVRTVRDPSEAFAFYSLANPALATILDTPYPPFPSGAV
jgi:hypothetical protein